MTETVGLNNWGCECHLLKCKILGVPDFLLGRGNEKFCFGLVGNEMPMRLSNKHTKQVYESRVQSRTLGLGMSWKLEEY